MNDGSYDVLFLDIDMPEEDGITFARRLKLQNNFTPVIFVSAREDRMFDTFSVQPFGFVRKSRLIADLNETVRLFLQSKPELSEQTVVFNTPSGVMKVNAKQIVYVDSSMHVQTVHLRSRPSFEVRSKMEIIENTLADKGFIRVHKGYIVNYRYIRRIGNDDVELVTGENIPLSRAKKREVKSLWLEYGSENGFTYLDEN